MEIVFQLIGIVLCGYMGVVALQIAFVMVGLVVFTCIETYKKFKRNFCPKWE